MVLLLAACAPLVADGAPEPAGAGIVPLAAVGCVTPLGAAGCGTPAPDPYVLAGGTVVGVGPADVQIADGRIVAVGAVSEGLPTVDVSGAWIAPAVIDSHVHLAYLPMAEDMARGGVAGVVDLAAPTSWLATDHGPLRVLASGPMITAVGGYPTEGWGRNGYGLEVATPEEATAAVDTLHAAGARVIKLPITSGPNLDDATFAAAVGRAHALGLPVVSHALGDADAARAAAAGVDALAHTPTEPLADPGAWSGRAVISTLGAFGGSSATVANLAALEAAGATVLYGTDFGNTRTPGVDAREVALLVRAGLTPEEVLAAMTSTPAAFWGLDDLGAVTPGKAASLLVLPGDPLVDPEVLATPTAVYLDGARME